MTRFPHSRCNL